MQLGWAVKDVLFPTPMVMEVGEKLTEESTGTEGVTVMVALAHLVAPLREATTVTRTIPDVEPAVKVVFDPVAGLTLPRVLLSVQE